MEASDLPALSLVSEQNCQLMKSGEVNECCRHYSCFQQHIQLQFLQFLSFYNVRQLDKKNNTEGLRAIENSPKKSHKSNVEIVVVFG